MLGTMSVAVVVDHLRLDAGTLPAAPALASISLPDVPRRLSPQSWPAVAPDVINRFTAGLPTADRLLKGARVQLLDVPESSQAPLAAVLGEQLRALWPHVPSWEFDFAWQNSGEIVPRKTSENEPFVQALPQRTSRTDLRLLIDMRGPSTYLQHNLTERLRDLRLDILACADRPKTLTVVA